MHLSLCVCIRVDACASKYMHMYQSICASIRVDTCVSEWMCVHQSGCVCIWVYTWCVCSTLGDQKVFDPLELELQTFVSCPMWVLGTNSFSIQEQPVFITSEPSLHLLFCFLFLKWWGLNPGDCMPSMHSIPHPEPRKETNFDGNHSTAPRPPSEQVRSSLCKHCLPFLSRWM